MKLNRGEPEHPHWKRPFSHQEKAVGWWGLGACFLALGLKECFDPSLPPFTGRWSWLKTMVSNAIGDRGLAMVYVGLGATLVGAGCLKWAKHLTHKRA